MTKKIKDFTLDSNILLLGVTGGIATGKSTVASMLEALGAFTIDFDILARKVVEPGSPAFEEIVQYFGKGIIGPDGSLDRRRLSTIVFQDPQKRKILESFTHQRIVDAFIEQAGKIARTNPEAILQAVIPLLFEVGLEYLVDKTLVVYTPQRTQIQRLVKRDKISQKQARQILKAQIPIDEKLRRADFIIYNDRSLEETKKQVIDLWRTLVKIQKGEH
ncbi:MAG: dephospho-CoA kinase [Deltaproteobacteria bacterium]|nr:MAG: dephospho-CoA kinase [Deltaproteobacteria bacterium]